MTEIQKEILGKTFGEFTVLSFMYRHNKCSYYLVQCNVCKHIKCVSITNIKKQIKNKSAYHSKLNCGINYYIKTFLNKIIGDYKIVGFIVDKKRGYLFQIKCLKCKHIKFVSLREILKGTFKHSYLYCEKDYLCYYKDRLIGDFKILFAKRNKNLVVYLYGKCLKCNTYVKIADRGIKHNICKHNFSNICIKSIKGKYKKEILKRYMNIIKRCYDRNHINYKNYGGRGITCDFDDSVDFYNYVKIEFENKANIHGVHNIEFDRINNNGTYSKHNLRVVTKSINNYNKNTSRIFCITDGEHYIVSNSVKVVSEKLEGSLNSLGRLIRGDSKVWKNKGYIWTLVQSVPLKNGNNFETEVEELCKNKLNLEKILVWE